MRLISKKMDRLGKRAAKRDKVTTVTNYDPETGKIWWMATLRWRGKKVESEFKEYNYRGPTLADLGIAQAAPRE
jgi:hypothetical protein